MKPDVQFDTQSKILKCIRNMNDNDLRIGQIMSNLFDEISKDGTDPFYVSDEKFLEYLQKYNQ